MKWKWKLYERDNKTCNTQAFLGKFPLQILKKITSYDYMVYIKTNLEDISPNKNKLDCTSLSFTDRRFIMKASRLFFTLALLLAIPVATAAFYPQPIDAGQEVVGGCGCSGTDEFKTCSEAYGWAGCYNGLESEELDWCEWEGGEGSCTWTDNRVCNYDPPQCSWVSAYTCDL